MFYLSAVLIFLMGFDSEFGFAQVDTSPVVRSSGASSSGPLGLPICVQKPEDIKKIQDWMENNLKSRFKYKEYREALRSDSETQLFARLLYSETVAANCPEDRSQVSPLIADVIGNRIRKKKGDVREVVFDYNQFASSLNHYTESRYRDFLCPADQDLWASSLKLAQAELVSQSKPARLSATTTHYFLYQHSPQYKKEPESFRKFLLDHSGSTDKSEKCVRFFKDPGWDLHFKN